MTEKSIDKYLEQNMLSLPRQQLLNSASADVNYDQEQFRALYLHKYQILNAHAHDPDATISSDKFMINSNGIVSPLTLILIFTLIMLSIANLNECNRTYWPHIKSLTNYFTISILQQDDLSIYDMGDNIDEPKIQLSMLEDIQDHFDNVIGFTGNYSQAGFVDFSAPDKSADLSVDVEFYYGNGTLTKKSMTFEQFEDFIHEVDIRQLLLKLRVLYIEIELGDSRYVDQFRVALDYEIYSHSMMRVQMSTKWVEKDLLDSAIRRSTILRTLQRLCAAILLVLYSLEMKKLYYNETINKQFRKNSLYWCASLIILNFVALSSSTFAPMCSVMQLLPIFQNHDSSNTLTFNFNVNLRYATPLVISALIPVYIVVNAFIFYSMIMYPGDYFDDYITSFFSYFYNNFQYGIYEIFTELKSKGNFAYFLYVVLYFYMVLVGGNLVPALFCILIYRKMAERELIRYVQLKLGEVVCPVCLQENYKKDKYGVQLNIKTPKSPYLKSGTTLMSPLQKTQQKRTKMFIEEKQGHISSPILSLKNKHKKTRDLVKQLKTYMEESLANKKQMRREWLVNRLHKISSTLQQIQLISRRKR